jgi:hypothetical protein
MQLHLEEISRAAAQGAQAVLIMDQPAWAQQSETGCS